MPYYEHNGRPGLYVEIVGGGPVKAGDMSEDRCFCGAEWNDVAECCVDGHPFGQEEKLRAELKQSTKHAKGLADLATHLQAELDKERGRADQAEHKLTQIRTILENYQNDEHFSAWNAIGAIEELKP